MQTIFIGKNANINSCFDAFSFVTNNNDYILSTSKGFKCMFVDYNEVDSVEIIITSNHEIIESNADELKNNKLIWNINDENAKDKQIGVAVMLKALLDA